MSATGRIALPRRSSSSHWDRAMLSESDPNAGMNLPAEYSTLAATLIRNKAGADADNLLAMLGLDGGTE